MKILVFGPRNRYEVYRPAFSHTLGAELVFSPSADRGAVLANPDTEVLFTDTIFDIDGPLMDLLPQLRLIQSEGVAFHRIDLEAARNRGIAVCNCKGCNAASVAEHTVMLLLMALRFGLAGHRAMLEGRQFAMKEQVMAADSPELQDCTVGLVGFGDIARQTALRLRPFGCRLCYCSLHRKSPETEAAFGLTWLPPEKLAAACDVLSLHCAVTPRTRAMVNEEFLSHVKPGAILINTARGELLDNGAVLRALESGRLSMLAADTLAPEPVSADHPLVAVPPALRDRIILSPHLGGNTGGAFRRAHGLMWENARALQLDLPLQNIVNP